MHNLTKGLLLLVTCFSSFTNLQRINYQGGKNLKYASAFAQNLQIEKIAIIFNIELLHIQLDEDPQRDDDASPMSSYRCMLRPT